MRHAGSGLAQFAQGAECDLVADRENAVARLVAVEHSAGGAAALFFAGQIGFDLDQPGGEVRGRHRLGIAVVALRKLALERTERADAGDGLAAALDQVGGGDPGAFVVVAADPFELVIGGAPADPVHACPAFSRTPEFAVIVPRRFVLGGADHDQAIGLALFLVPARKVGGAVLKADQRFVPARRCRGADRAEQGIGERVEVLAVLIRAADHHHRQRPGLAGAQAGGVVVDVVVEFARGFGNPQPGRLADHRIARQRAADGRLADPGFGGNVERGDPEQARLRLVHHIAEMPPSSLSSAPVMKRLSSLAR